MSQLRLYLDEDAQRTSFVSALRKAAIDVLTASEVERLGYSDDQQLQWASEQSRTLYTFNVKDFSRLHNSWLAEDKTHAGMIVVPRQRYSVSEQLKGVLAIALTYSAQDVINQLLYLSNYISN